MKAAEAEEVRARREGAGLTQQEVADLLGVTLNGYQHLEYGVRPIQAPAWRLLFILTAPKPGIAARHILKKYGRKK